MTQWSRRKLLKSLAAASTAAVIPAKRARAQAASSTPASQPEIQITSVSAHTFRLSILAARDGSTGAIPSDGSLVRDSFGPPLATVREQPEHPVVAGNFKLTVSLHPVSITIANQRGLVVQQLGWTRAAESFHSPAETRLCSAWGRAVRNSTAADQPIECIADRAATSWRPTAVAFLSPGSSEHPAGRSFFTNHLARSTSPDLKASFYLQARSQRFLLICFLSVHRSRNHHGGILPAHGPRGDTPAMELWLPAIASHSCQSGRSDRRGKDLPR
jgi:hypothetical protein